jgi:hypothetical protein
VDFTCTKFEALSLPAARETDGGTKNVKKVCWAEFSAPCNAVGIVFKCVSRI